MVKQGVFEQKEGLANAPDFLPLQEMQRMNGIISVGSKGQNDVKEVGRHILLHKIAGRGGIRLEKGIRAKVVMIPGRIGKHVMVQDVIAVPSFAGKAIDIETQEGPAPVFVFGLVDPIVSETAEDGTDECRGNHKDEPSRDIQQSHQAQPRGETDPKETHTFPRGFSFRAVHGREISCHPPS